MLHRIRHFNEVMRSYFLPVAILILCICRVAPQALGQSPDEASSKLTIATWNVEWFFDSDKSDNDSGIAKEQSPPSNDVWKWKLNAVVDVISKLRPTVLAVQEIEDRDVLLAVTNELRNRHSLFYRVAFIEGFDMGTEQDVGILYQSGLVEFSRREQNRSMFESQEYYNLSKHIIGKFEWVASDGQVEKLTLLTTHFRANQEAAEPRRKQAKLTHQWLKASVEANENVVLLGDFNLESTYGNEDTLDDGIQYLIGKHTESDKDGLVDLHQFIEPAKRKTHLILDKQFDRIFVSQSMLDDMPGVKDLTFVRATTRPDLVIVGRGIDEDHWDSRYTKEVSERDLSDHYPVVAEFEFR